MPLEVACFNAASAHIASAAGASRIELCADRASGGVTPSLDTVLEICSTTSIPIYAMIRPRGGSFVYTASELHAMRASIQALKPYVSGFVFGVSDGQVNVLANTELVALARPLPCTFHRAFDQMPDLFRALEDVVQCGFSSILTSGGRASASMAVDVLTGLIAAARGRVHIIPGGGVRSADLAVLKIGTGAEWYHSSAIDGEGEVASRQEIVALLDVMNERR